MSVNYIIIGYCSDCTGIDKMGCNEGDPFDLGESNDFDYAKSIALDHVRDCSPYYAEVINKETQQIIWTTKD